MSDFQRLYVWRRQMLDSFRGYEPDFEQGALVLGTRVMPGPLDLTWDPATRTMTVDRPEDV